MSGGKKFCKECDEDRPLSEFGTNGSPNTFKPLCKKHTLEYTRKLKSEKKERIIKENKVIDKPKKRFCNKCEKTKPIRKFDPRESIYNKNNEPLYLRYSTCRKCNDSTKTPEKVKSYRKTTKQRRKENGKVAKYNEKYKPKRNENERLKCRNDPIYKIMKTLRNRASQIMVKNNIKTTGKCKLIGMTKEEYHEFLTFMMETIDDDMNIDNHGAYWHIDHVIPCDTFKFADLNDPMIKMCFGWFNTQPMKKELNIAKLNRIDKDEITEHIIRLYYYVDECNPCLIRYVDKYAKFAMKYLK